MAVADVYDGTGNLICGSDKLINSGVCQWEEFIEKNNFIQ